MNRLKALQRYGQSVWLDSLSRDLIQSGGLQRLVDEDGLSGVTSNPTIFDKAIRESSDYDDALQELVRRDPQSTEEKLFQALATEDIRMAADVLRPIYDASGGGDGLVSLEVSPRLAHDTQASIAEARHLWKTVARPNVMIKIPATPEGMPAIEMLSAEGVNVTLIFSLRQYEAAARAYLRGIARHPQPGQVVSVASLFVSRVDTAADPLLDKIGSAAALALKGRIAVANAKRAYRRFREIFDGPEFAAQRARHVRIQRPLWGSTGTKNKAYSDVLYVEQLIGPDTVNTMPTATLDAFRDHGETHATLTKDMAQADAAISSLPGLGIDLDAVTDRLLDEGVASFAKSYDDLMSALRIKREAIRSQTDRQAAD